MTLNVIEAYCENKEFALTIGTKKGISIKSKWMRFKFSMQLLYMNRRWSTWKNMHREKAQECFSSAFNLWLCGPANSEVLSRLPCVCGGARSGKICIHTKTCRTSWKRDAGEWTMLILQKSCMRVLIIYASHVLNPTRPSIEEQCCDSENYDNG